MGEAIAELVRQAMNPGNRIEAGGVFPHFSVRRNARPITLKQTLEAEDQL